MDIFIRAEYIIANVLIELSKKGKKSIAVSKLKNIGAQLQKSCNDAKLEVVILISNDKINAAIDNFPDYFEYVIPIDKEPMICIKKDASISNIERQFTGYLPFEILKLILNKISELIA